MDTPIKIRDRRTRRRFFIDNAIIRIYGSQLGPYGLAAYAALCLHADLETQTCFPSFQKMADLVGMSRRQMIREINKLERLGLIAVTRQKQARKHLPNVYTLIDPPCLQGGSDRESPPSDRESLGVVTGSHPNNPQLNNPKEQMFSPQFQEKAQKSSPQSQETSIDDSLPPAEEQASILFGGRLKKQHEEARCRIMEAFAEVKGIEVPTTAYYLEAWQEGCDIMLAALGHDADKIVAAIYSMAQDEDYQWRLDKATTPKGIAKTVYDLVQSGKLRRKPGGPTEAELRQEAKRCYRQATSPYGQCLWVLGYNLAQCQFCPYPKEHPNERKIRRRLAREAKEQSAGLIEGRRKVAGAVAAVAGKMTGGQDSQGRREHAKSS